MVYFNSICGFSALAFPPSKKTVKQLRMSSISKTQQEWNLEHSQYQLQRAYTEFDEHKFYSCA